MEYNTVVLKKYNQLSIHGDFSSEQYWNATGGATFTIYNKSMTCNFTAATTSRIQTNWNTGYFKTLNHRYYISVKAKSNINCTLFQTLITSYQDSVSTSLTANVWERADGIFTSRETTETSILRFFADRACVVELKEAMLVDLTAIYGEHNEPTEVDQFLTDYPEFNKYVEYKENGYFEKKYDTLVGKISKNLFDISQIIGVGHRGDTTSVSNDYGYVVENSIVSKYGLYGTSTICKGFYIELKRNTAYTLTLDVRLTQSSSLTSKQIFAGFRSFDNASSNVSSFNITNFGVFERHSIQFTPSNDYNGYLSIQAAGNAGVFTNLDCKFKDIQLELGSTATEYEPYGWIEKEYNALTLKKYNQLINIVPSQPTVYNGITITKNNNGTITASGTATSTLYFQVQNTSGFNVTTIGNKYLLIGCPIGGSAQTYCIVYNTNGYAEIGNGAIIERNSGGSYYDRAIILQIKSGQTVNLVFKPQLVDLTKMYGAGNEPTTVQKFLEDNPQYNNYVPYSEGGWM